eukprot:4611218-Pyramimonas_sp.AAC.1
MGCVGWAFVCCVIDGGLSGERSARHVRRCRHSVPRSGRCAPCHCVLGRRYIARHMTGMRVGRALTHRSHGPAQSWEAYILQHHEAQHTTLSDFPPFTDMVAVCK